MPNLPLIRGFSGICLSFHSAVSDRDNAVSILYVGGSGGLKVGQCLGEVDGRAAGSTRELFDGTAQLARAVELMHGAEQIHPDAASSGRTEGKGWVF